MALYTTTPLAAKVDCQRHRIDGYQLTVRGGKSVWVCRACGEPQISHMTTDEQIERNKFDLVKIVALAELDRQPRKTYSGKVGCMCGCRGNYSTHKATMTATVNKMRRLVEQATPEDPNGLMLDEGNWIAVDNGTRQYTAYTAE